MTDRPTTCPDCRQDRHYSFASGWRCSKACEDIADLKIELAEVTSQLDDEASTIRTRPEVQATPDRLDTAPIEARLEALGVFPPVLKDESRLCGDGVTALYFELEDSDGWRICGLEGGEWTTQDHGESNAMQAIRAAIESLAHAPADLAALLKENAALREDLEILKVLTGSEMPTLEGVETTTFAPEVPGPIIFDKWKTRGNNPGNMKADARYKWDGEIGEDLRGHIIFDTLENGVRAFAKMLLNIYAGKHGPARKTIRGIITGGDKEPDVERAWTSVEGDWKPYILQVVRHTGIMSGSDLGLSDEVHAPKDTAAKLIAAMTITEHGAGTTIPEDVLEAGVARGVASFMEWWETRA